MTVDPPTMLIPLILPLFIAGTQYITIYKRILFFFLYQEA